MEKVMVSCPHAEEMNCAGNECLHAWDHAKNKYCSEVCEERKKNGLITLNCMTEEQIFRAWKKMMNDKGIRTPDVSAKVRNAWKRYEKMNRERLAEKTQTVVY